MSYQRIFSSNNIQWDYNKNNEFSYIGGLLKMNNLSGGFHGILKQWWEFYLNKKSPKVLLVTESNDTKNEFNEIYNDWEIHTLNLYTELNKTSDISSDITCDICNTNIVNKYDLIINQATLEHLYNPFYAMENMCNALNDGGYLITHTHSQNMPYHQYPRDYVRFMIDWWYDLPQYIKDIKLMELYEDDRYVHVFTCYKKIK